MWIINCYSSFNSVSKSVTCNLHMFENLINNRTTLYVHFDWHSIQTHWLPMLCVDTTIIFAFGPFSIMLKFQYKCLARGSDTNLSTYF